MIYKGLKSIISASYAGQLLTRICHGARQVWAAARACFSNGWDRDKGWYSDEGWGD